MIFFLIPLFNEAPNIRELSARLSSLRVDDEYHVVLVNDCSTDDTVKMIEKYFQHLKHSLLTNPQNSGPGFSFNKGFEFILSASQNETDLVVTMEGDNTSDFTIFPQMYALAHQWNYDLVLSSVYAQGGGFSKTSFIRKLISLLANQLMRFVFNVKVLTLSSFYRVYKVSLVRKIKARNTHIIKEHGFICALELLIKSIQVNAHVIEVPMLLKSDMRKGKSKMKIFKTSWEYLRFLGKHIIPQRDSATIK